MKTETRTPITRRSFLNRSATLLGGALAGGVTLSGCGKPNVDQGKIFQNDPGPGMDYDPSMVKWSREEGYDIAMDGAKNLRILPSGGVVVSGAEGLESVNISGYNGPALIPTVSEPRFDFIEGPKGGFFTVSRQDIIHHTSAEDHQGTLILSLGGNAYLTNIETDGESLYVADMGNRLFWNVSLEGRMIAKWGEKDPEKNQPGLVVPSPYLELTLDAQNRLWGVNPGRHSVDLYDENFAVVRSWGFASARTPGFCGCCNPTHLIALADGTFLTCEKGLPRVKQYSPKGELIGLVVPPDHFEAGNESIVIAARSAEDVLVMNPVAHKIWRYKKTVSA